MSGNSEYPMALPAPTNAVSAIDEELVLQAVAASRESPRKRIIQPLHKEGAAVLQRMLNAIQPGSYIRPHRHAVDRAESIIVIAGSLLYLVFNEKGEVSQFLELRAGTACFGVDTEGGVWHSFLAMEPDTVLFEVKPGPYDAVNDKEFASWAPVESGPQATEYLEVLQKR